MLKLIILMMLIAASLGRPGYVGAPLAAAPLAGPLAAPVAGPVAAPVSAALVEEPGIVAPAPALAAHPAYLAHSHLVATPVITGYSHNSFFRAPPALVAPLRLTKTYSAAPLVTAPALAPAFAPALAPYRVF